jgi:uncharacterized DUF497 family protein
MPFRWNEWNIDHIAKHGVDPIDAESIVVNARTPYPHRIGDEKWIAIGQVTGGFWLQVIYVYDPDGITVYIIHARPLTQREKQRARRRRK